MAYLLSDETESNLTTTWGITQGQLKVDTILVDRQGCCWLTDFSQVGPGPRLRDFIELEMSIKLDLLSGFDLQAGQRLAQADLIPEQPISETAALSPEIQKAVQVIEVIRRLAGTAVSTEADGYRHGLLLKAIAQLADYQPQFDYTHRERLPYLYCLMSAALLSQHLAPEPPADLPDQAKDSLWINEERKEVWITGQSIKLAPAWASRRPKRNGRRWPTSRSAACCSRTRSANSWSGCARRPRAA
jgi:hypothetical protein